MAREHSVCEVEIEFVKDDDGNPVINVGDHCVDSLVSRLVAIVSTCPQGEVIGVLSLGVAFGAVLSGLPIEREGLLAVFNAGLEQAFVALKDNGEGEAGVTSIQSHEVGADKNFDFRSQLSGRGDDGTSKKDPS